MIRDRTPIVKELDLAVAVTYEQINVIVNQDVILIISDQPFIAAHNYGIWAVATYNERFGFHVPTKDGESLEDLTPTSLYSVSALPSFLCKHANREAYHIPASVQQEPVQSLPLKPVFQATPAP